MSAPTPAGESSGKPAIPDEAYTYALEQLMRGSRPADVRKSLLSAGYQARQVDQIISYAQQYQREHEPAGDAANHGVYISVGVMLWIVGIVVRVGRIGDGMLSPLIFLTDFVGLILIVVGIVMWRRSVNAPKK
jgi:hypothetical protein